VTRRELCVSVIGGAAAGLGCQTKKADTDPPSPAEYKVRLQTTKGDIVILVHRDWSPLGADHFYRLVKNGFYNDNAFFRIVPGFIVQWGMNGDPAVNRKWNSQTIPDDPPKVSNKVGTVVFAKTSQPNSRNTQLFINLGDNSGSLDPQGFTPFGEVIQGMDNVMHLESEYGEKPDQEAISMGGNTYLKSNFPQLDYVKTAVVEG
jgi:peptidyl-prolyl cis-trans isomerase A (cyclophilin A)